MTSGPNPDFSDDPLGRHNHFPAGVRTLDRCPAMPIPGDDTFIQDELEEAAPDDEEGQSEESEEAEGESAESEGTENEDEEN